jgi:hypothetical protein
VGKGIWLGERSTGSGDPSDHGFFVGGYSTKKERSITFFGKIDEGKRNAENHQVALQEITLGQV